MWFYRSVYFSRTERSTINRPNSLHSALHLCIFQTTTSRSSTLSLLEAFRCSVSHHSRPFDKAKTFENAAKDFQQIFLDPLNSTTTVRPASRVASFIPKNAHLGTCRNHHNCIVWNSRAYKIRSSADAEVVLGVRLLDESSSSVREGEYCRG